MLFCAHTKLGVVLPVQKARYRFPQTPFRARDVPDDPHDFPGLTVSSDANFRAAENWPLFTS